MRDLLLGKGPPRELDFLAPDPQRAAREAQEALGGVLFPLDPERGYFRVVGGRLTLDFTPLEGPLEEDLWRRDFRLNALVHFRGRFWGLRGAEEDLRQRVLVPVAEANLLQDPLRGLRGVRLAAELGLGLPPRTREALREVARHLEAHPEALPAEERVGEELRRLLLSPKAAWGLGVLEETGLLRAFLPELRFLPGLEQGGVHHLEAFRHTLSVLFHLQWLWPKAPLEARLAALFHDVGKPLVRRFDREKGRYRFLGHAEVGAGATKAALTWLRFSRATVEKVAALVGRHMDHPPQGGEVRRFLLRRQDLLPDLLYLMAADRLATREGEGEAWKVLGLLKALEANPLPTRPLLSGEEVMALLGLPPGPKVGEALRALLEAQAEGRVKTPEEARAFLLYWRDGKEAQAPRAPDHPH